MIVSQKFIDNMDIRKGRTIMKIEIKNLTKKIKGNTVLENVNHTFESGKVYGLHGRNGSGKTMLLRSICGLILPTEGSVVIDGKVVGKDIEFPESVGIIIEHMSMVDDMTGFDNLKALAKINNSVSDDDIRMCLADVGLDPEDKRKVKKYSLGMKQKLNIAQAVMEKPKLLLLDEPTNGLDKESIAKFYDILKRLKADGTLIIIAIHITEDSDALCDEIIEVEEGKLVG